VLSQNTNIRFCCPIRDDKKRIEIVIHEKAFAD